MKIAIMQPYFAPYLGYFQLIEEADLFVFYDDVNFINRGWINRNFLNIQDRSHRFTIPLIKASQNKKINEVDVDWNCKKMAKLLKTFEHTFKNKPIASEIIESIILEKPKTIADMAIMSIELICSELGIKTQLKRSSQLEYTKVSDKALNLIEICKLYKATNYINAEGGQELYSKEEFSKYGVSLQFLKGLPSTSLLNIIDLPITKNQLYNYECI